MDRGITSAVNHQFKELCKYGYLEELMEIMKSPILYHQIQ